MAGAVKARAWNRGGGLLLVAAALWVACGTSSAPGDNNGGNGGGDGQGYTPVRYTPDQLVMGVDLSYVNQILDHGGTYSDSLGVRDPYAIFADHGANVVRLRLWHDPEWVRTQVYHDSTAPLYSGLEDVARAIEAAHGRGMEVDLDLHYSDTWADPGHQDVPAAWKDISDLGVLEDTVYAYTSGVLQYLDSLGLLPEMVQVGNETNCGMLVTNGGASFPALNVCDGHWASQGRVMNAGIRAVRDTDPGARIVIHIAQPENVDWFFTGITTTGGVSDFDIIGFSYYSPWSSQPLSSIAGHISGWRQEYGKDVMIMETAYPWTLQNADSYGNIFGQSSLVSGYPATPAGQRQYMVDLVQAVIDGGGSGVFYWEPAWITSSMRDLWGTGSSWDNNTLVDFQGRVHDGMKYLTWPYKLQP